jgi:hypothetical protein
VTKGTRSGFIAFVAAGAALALPLFQPAVAAGAAAYATLGHASAAEVAHYRSQLPGGAAVDCTGPETFPTPGSAAWTQRDEENQFCATGRLQDELANPAQGAAFASQTPGLYIAQNLAMLAQPGHLHLSLAQFIPGGTTTDAFRTIARWTAAKRGTVTPVRFVASDGAYLNGFVFAPPMSGRDPVTGITWNRSSRLPGVVITTGSIQGYQQMYFWAAEGLAEAGYVVLTYDVQGQGNSDTFPGGGPAQCVSQLAGSSGACTGVPFQQSYNFFQGAEDSLNFFLSTPKRPYEPASASNGIDGYDPVFARIDPDHIGIAGHSLGATAVSALAQCDPRVQAVVAWDYLSAASGPCRSSFTGLPASSPVDPRAHAPALSLNSDYFLNPGPTTSQPDPTSDTKSSGFEQVASEQVDSMQVSLRGSTHLEYSYVPYILPASALGERVAFYYTLAWLDRYVRGADNQAIAAGAEHRLTSLSFGTSSDLHSIGAGTYSPAKALSDPTDPTAGNLSPDIAGLATANQLSFYFPSMYRLTNPVSDTVTSCNTTGSTLGHQCWGGPTEY